MKTNRSHDLLAALAIAGLPVLALTALAQDPYAKVPVQPVPAAVSAPMPKSLDGVSQVLQLAQAKVADDTIIAYIRNSGASYALDADQIISLRQHGLSDAVITAMLSQPKPMIVYAAPPAPAPQPAAPASPEPAPSVAAVQPTVTYVQTVPAQTYYYAQPYYGPAYGPAYGWYPGLSFVFGWGRGWGWHGHR